MNLAFHLMALFFLMGLSWAWLVERKKNKLLCELRLHASIARGGKNFAKVYVHHPVGFLEEILNALQIEIEWNTHSKALRGGQATFNNIQKINPFPLFLFLVNHPIAKVQLTEVVCDKGKVQLQCVLIASNMSGSPQDKSDSASSDPSPPSLKETFGPDILFTHSFLRGDLL